MNDSESKIKVALLQNAAETQIELSGAFLPSHGNPLTGQIFVRCRGKEVILANTQKEIMRGKEIFLSPANPAKTFFTVKNILIGIDFHWQRLEEQSFCGSLTLSAQSNDTFHLLNSVGLEEYLASVISSEMSADAPLEFLKAQAITARSWLVAMLEKKKCPKIPQKRDGEEICVWQDVNDHQGFDVCADDHCQRYQGITRIISENVARAVTETRGVFLTSGGQICDARYYKCCGGLTDVFATAWEDASFSYLTSVADFTNNYETVSSESKAAAWLGHLPEAYCNTTNLSILQKILPSFDLETLNFFRWRVEYSRKELEDILKIKSGLDFGELRQILPLMRGPSGRIHRLKITGTLREIIVGKELEIRRWLAPTHLLSSAFVITAKSDAQGRVLRFILDGGGWGHGVGLCQIGAAVMAVKGRAAEEILAHYFPGAILRKLY